MSRAGRRWTWTAGLVGVSAAAVIPILGLAAARTLGDSTAGTLDVAAGTAAPASETPGALLVAVDGSDVVGLTVLAVGPTGAGGTAVVVPTGSMTSVDGFDQPTRLAAAYGQGGLDAQVTATAGMLGVTFSAAQQVDEAGLRALLEPLGPITVDLPEAVVRTAADGTAVLELPAGPQELTAEQAAAVLFTRTPNETEAVRLPAQRAVWKGIVDAAQRVAAPATDAPPADAAGFLAAIGAGPRDAGFIDGSPALDSVTNPQGIDLLEVDMVDVRVLMARLLPSAASPTGSGLRVRLTDHSGDPAALYQATARLQLVGATVVAIDDLTSGPAVVKETTLAYDPAISQERVNTLTLAVGPVVGAPATERIDGIDVTIDLGRDFMSFLSDEAARTVGDVATATTGG